MRNILLWILSVVGLAAIACPDHEGHIVAPGETLEDIAWMYGTTIDRIIEHNPHADNGIFVGMELDVEGYATNPTGLQTAYIKRECDKAYNLLRQKENGKAIKEFSKVIKRFENTHYSCSPAYYGRGSAYYDENNWKKAIEDFAAVVGDPLSDPLTQASAESLLEESTLRREQQLEERREMWSGIAASLVVATANTYVAVEQSKAAGRSYPTTSAGGVSAGNINLLLDPNYAIRQTEAKLESEYQEMRRYNPNLTRDQFMQMKAEAYQATKDNSSNENYSGGGSSTSSTSGTETVAKPRKKDCESLHVAHGKWYCANTGRCGMCNGRGVVEDDMFGTGKWHKCSLCGGSGKCKYCN